MEISGGFSVKQHVSSAVRVLTRGSSPVNGKLRLESHGGGLEEVFDVLDACRFYFFFSIHVDKKMAVLEPLSYLGGLVVGPCIGLGLLCCLVYGPSFFQKFVLGCCNFFGLVIKYQTEKKKKS